jgi:hypothetical protein
MNMAENSGASSMAQMIVDLRECNIALFNRLTERQNIVIICFGMYPYIVMKKDTMIILQRSIEAAKDRTQMK